MANIYKGLLAGPWRPSYGGLFDGPQPPDWLEDDGADGGDLIDLRAYEAAPERFLFQATDGAVQVGSPQPIADVTEPNAEWALLWPDDRNDEPLRHESDAPMAHAPMVTTMVEGADGRPIYREMPATILHPDAQRLETISVHYAPADYQDARHKYVVYTDRDGRRFFARGGPESRGKWPTFPDGLLGGPWGDIHAESGPYVPGSIDWDPENDDPRESIHIAEHLRPEYEAVVDNFEDMDDRHDYWLAFQNSNSIVDEALRRAHLPDPQLDEEVWAPGSDWFDPEEEKQARRERQRAELQAQRDRHTAKFEGDLDDGLWRSFLRSPRPSR
jgi:hypothetical protein